MTDLAEALVYHHKSLIALAAMVEAALARTSRSVVHSMKRSRPRRLEKRWASTPPRGRSLGAGLFADGGSMPTFLCAVEASPDGGKFGGGSLPHCDPKGAQRPPNPTAKLRPAPDRRSD